MLVALCVSITMGIFGIALITYRNGKKYGNLWEFMRIYGNLWKSMGIYENLWESTGYYEENLKRILITYSSTFRKARYMTNSFSIEKTRQNLQKATPSDVC